MKRTVRRVWLASAIGFQATSWSVSGAVADAVVGNGTSASCTEVALDTALAAGGLVRFNCGSAPKVIVVTAPKAIARGGVYVGSGEATVTNVTLSGNSAGYGGGLFSAGGTTTMANATLADNVGRLDGGAVFRDAGLVVLRSSIIAGTLPQSLSTDIASQRQIASCGGSVTSLGYNVAEDTSCRLDKTGDVEDEPALLDPLADNGGPTWTHVPRARIVLPWLGRGAALRGPS